MARARIFRKGHLITRNTSENQCRSVGHKDYEYQAMIEANENDLDESQFIIDNMLLHRVVVACFEEGMTSCEGMVSRIGRCVLKAVTDNGVNPLRIKITVSPRFVDNTDYAWFEWEWDAVKEYSGKGNIADLVDVLYEVRNQEAFKKMAKPLQDNIRAMIGIYS